MEVIGRNHYLGTLELYNEAAEVFYHCDSKLPDKISELLGLLDEIISRLYNVNLKDGQSIQDLTFRSSKEFFSTLYSLSSALHFLKMGLGEFDNSKELKTLLEICLNLFIVHSSSNNLTLCVEDKTKRLFLVTRVYDTLAAILKNLKSINAKKLTISCMWKCLESVIDSITSDDSAEDEDNLMHQLCFIIEFVSRVAKVDPAINLMCISSNEHVLIKLLKWKKFADVCISYDLKSFQNPRYASNPSNSRVLIVGSLLNVFSSLLRLLMSIDVNMRTTGPQMNESDINRALISKEEVDSATANVLSCLMENYLPSDINYFDDEILGAMKTALLAGIYNKSTATAELVIKTILKSIEDSVNTRHAKHRDSFYPAAIECLDFYYNVSDNDQLKIKICFIVGNFLFSTTSLFLSGSLPPKQALAIVVRSSLMLIKEGMLESMASGRIVNYMHVRATKMPQTPLSKDAAIVYINATIGLILASKYLPGNMVRSIYEVARKFDSMSQFSPLSYVYIFIPFYLMVAPRMFLADFIDVTLSGHSFLIDQIDELSKLLNLRSIISHDRCVTLLNAAFEEFRDRRIAFQGSVSDANNAGSIDFLFGLVKYCNIIMKIIINSYENGNNRATKKIILGLKRVWMAASDVLLTPEGEWNPSYKPLMIKFDAHRIRLIKSMKLYIYDPNNSDVTAAELRKTETKELETRNALANVLQSNTVSCEEIMSMDICTVVAILEVYLVESMSIQNYDCCHLEDVIHFLDSTNKDLADTATCDLLFKTLTDIFVKKKRDTSNKGLKNYLTDLIRSFTHSSVNMREHLLHAIVQTLKSAPFLYWDEKNLFICLDILRYHHREPQVKYPTKSLLNEYSEVKEEVLKSLVDCPEFVDLFTKMVYNWINVATSLSLHETARVIERYMFSYRFRARKEFGHSRSNQDFIRLLMSINISPPLVRLILEHRGSNDMEIGRFLGMAEAQTKADLYDGLESCLNARAEEVAADLQACLFSTSSTTSFTKLSYLAYDAANLIIMGYRDESLLHLLYTIPVAYFNTTVVKLCGSLWHSIVTYCPSHRSRIVLQIMSLWKHTSLNKLGIYSQVRRRRSINKRAKDKVNCSTNSFSHMIIFKLLLELFTYDSYELPMLKMYGEFVISSLEKMSSSGIEHSATRDVYINLIIFGINVIEFLSAAEATISLVYTYKLMTVITSLYELSHLPPVTEKEHLDTIISLHELLKDFDIDYIHKLASEDSDQYPHSAYVHMELTSKKLNHLKKTALMLLESEISQKQVWLDPLGADVSRRFPLENLNAASRRDFIKNVILCLLDTNPKVLLYMKSYIKNLPDIYYSSLEKACTLLSYSLMDTSEYPNTLLKVLNKPEIDTNHRLIMYSTHLSPSRVLYWLNVVTKYNPWVLQYLIRILRNSSIRTLLFYVPQLVQSLRNDCNGYVEETIIRLACNSEYFAHQILWNMSASMSVGHPDSFTLTLRRVQDKIISQFSDLEKKFYDIEFSLFNNITDISRKLMPLVEYRASSSAKKKKIDEELAKIHVPPGAYLPINPKYTLVEIDHNSGKPLQSHSKAPFIVTFKISENVDFLKENREHQNTLDIKQVKTIDMYSIFKAGDDCRQDQLALQLITLFKQAFTIEGLNLYVYPYKVVATSPKCGIIEVIPSSISRDIIGREKINSLYGWFVAEFGGTGSQKFNNACIEFTKSMAAYSVILYLLQIKDRHNGNIMIDKNGRIIHIDFGFMISTAPGRGILESSPFKLTSDMIKIMGTDERSPLYTMFKELCVKAFLAARNYAYEIINATYVMKNSGLPCFKGKDSIRNLRERFALEKTDQQASEIMLNCIKASHANTRSNLYDKFQYLQNGIPY